MATLIVTLLVWRRFAGRETMAEELGTVESITDDGWARVVTDRKDACAGCGASHCCTSFGSNSEMVVKALNRAGARVGDLVSITLSSGMVVKGAAILYLIPVLGLVIGALVAKQATDGLPFGETGNVIVFGLSGLVLGFILTTTISRWMAARNRFTPVIMRIVRPRSRDEE
jgi:sigma-E factor negative regulatory protein RseC